MTTAERLTNAYLQVVIDVVGVGKFEQQDLARLNILEQWGFDLDDRANPGAEPSFVPQGMDALRERATPTPPRLRSAPQMPAAIPFPQTGGDDATEIATRPEVQALTGEDPAPHIEGAADVDARVPEAGETLDTRAPDPDERPMPGAPDYSKL